jgi:hypothetical protein
MRNLDNRASRLEATTVFHEAPVVQSFVVGARLGETEDQTAASFRREHPDTPADPRFIVLMPIAPGAVHADKPCSRQWCSS